MEVNTVAEYELRRYFFFEILFYCDAKLIVTMFYTVGFVLGVVNCC